jgi:molybdenum cofactor guanylyltransferase
MRLLGAILAGGEARRFGSDKALAPVGGRAMIDHVADRLRPQVAALVVVGRDHGAFTRIDDAPAPGLGPLGALLGALRHAAEGGYDAVLSAPCDMPLLPPDLADRLRPAPAYVAQHPVVGLWPVEAAPLLATILDSDNRAVRAFADRCGARAVSIDGLININRPGDLERLGPIGHSTVEP